ncbi:ribonuclease VapC [Azospirillum brasilense]|uniref:Ribonuclease VapC n=1 Tax=Azospirillum brasilense TaxID=192 RepID=A0A560B017_AZOBR|nr:type II toxin-antitoxin system VapC family toxin [Azospirillum brasilense]TWA65967.1 ribonuclease VapC [Azospirillum brasilense]
MIVDTSALVAILRSEPDARDYAVAIEKAPVRRISAANLLEAAIVIDGSRDETASRSFDTLIDAAGSIIEPVTEEQARTAREAYRRFGRGSGHPAKLNLRRLLRLRSVKSDQRAVAVQRTGLSAHRHPVGPALPLRGASFTPRDRAPP